METHARTLRGTRVGSGLILRLPAVAGITAPVLFWIVLITAGLIRPSYSPIRQYGSELGIGSNAWLMQGGFIMWGLLQLPFAWGLDRGIARKPNAVVAAPGPALVALAGIAMILVGIFHGTPTYTTTFTETMHLRATKLLFGSMVMAFFALAWRFWWDPRWHGYAAYSIVAGVVGAVLFYLYGWATGLLDLASWIGLEQRMLLAVTLGWLGILAVRLYRLDDADKGDEILDQTMSRQREGM